MNNPAINVLNEMGDKIPPWVTYTSINFKQTSKNAIPFYAGVRFAVPILDLQNKMAHSAHQVYWTKFYGGDDWQY